MFGPAYVLTYGVLAGIPSLDDRAKSVTDDTFEFWQASPWSDRARLVEQGAAINASLWGLSNKDRFDLISLMLQPEKALGPEPIAACFVPHFFETKLWLMWCSMFGFETWHSATELRRDLLRWLVAQGVQVDTGVEVTDLHLEPSPGGHAVRRLDCLRSGVPTCVAAGQHDLVIATLGSMTANASLGSMDSPPNPFKGDSNPSWTLWEGLAAKDTAFGNPAAFCGHVEQPLSVTFTVTDRGDLFA